MTDKEKDDLIAEVIENFDFERARAVAVLTARDIRHLPSIQEMKAEATDKLRKAIDHRDRTFWWAGGMHHGGLCVCYDDTWGLSLNYIAKASRVRVPKNL
jgi:hypothetical protein